MGIIQRVSAAEQDMKLSQRQKRQPGTSADKVAGHNTQRDRVSTRILLLIYKLLLELVIKALLTSFSLIKSNVFELSSSTRLSMTNLHKELGSDGAGIKLLWPIRTPLGGNRGHCDGSRAPGSIALSAQASAFSVP